MMNTKLLLLCFCICLLNSFILAEESSLPNSQLSGKKTDSIQIHELFSRMRKQYHVLICIEDIPDGDGSKLDNMYFDPKEFNLSHMQLRAVLEKMEMGRLICKTNESFLVFRPVEYNTNNTPLAKMMPPFKFSGTLGGLLDYVVANNKDIQFAEIETTSGIYEKFPKIDLTFDSRVSIEDVLFSLTKKYGITWRATVYPNPKIKFSPGEDWLIIWEFHFKLIDGI